MGIYLALYSNREGFTRNRQNGCSGRHFAFSHFAGRVFPRTRREAWLIRILVAHIVLKCEDNGEREPLQWRGLGTEQRRSVESDSDSSGYRYNGFSPGT